MRRFASVFLVSLLVATPLHAGDAQNPRPRPTAWPATTSWWPGISRASGRPTRRSRPCRRRSPSFRTRRNCTRSSPASTRATIALEALTAAEALKRDPNNREANRSSGPSWRFLRTRRSPCARVMIPRKYAARAIAALEKARGDGTDLNLLLMLGKLQLRPANMTRPPGPYGRILDEQPQYTEGGMLLASAQEGAGRIDDAITTLEGALGQPDALPRLGEADPALRAAAAVEGSGRHLCACAGGQSTCGPPRRSCRGALERRRPRRSATS